MKTSFTTLPAVLWIAGILGTTLFAQPSQRVLRTGPDEKPVTNISMVDQKTAIVPASKFKIVRAFPSANLTIAPFTGSATDQSLHRDARRAPGFSQTDAPGDVVNFSAAMNLGATYVRNMQAAPPAAGWDWSTTFFTNQGGSYSNLYGVCALGMYYAYVENGNSPSSLFAGMASAADAIVALGTGNARDASAIKFLMLYNDLPGVSGTTYKDAAKAKYDWLISNRGGTATTFAEYIRNSRVSQGYPNGIIGWDVGAYAVAAQMLFDRFGGTYDANADAIAEVLYQDAYVLHAASGFDLVRCSNWDASPDSWWFTLGVSGLMEAFYSSNSHTSEMSGLVAILMNSRAASGAFCDGPGVHAGDESWQATAYCVMALSHVPSSAYAMNTGAYYLAATQHSSGGWVYGDGYHYPEIGAECVSALSLASPATTVYVDATFNSTSFGTHVWGYDALSTIQGGIDAVAPGGTVNVYPGSYNEAAINRTPTAIPGSYTFGLFIGQNKSGITIQGVNASSVPVTSYTGILANVETQATNNFGPDGVYMEGDNVTMTGLKIWQNISLGTNKTITVVGNNFALKFCHITDVSPGGPWASVYMTDDLYNTATNTSHIQSYTIEGNWLENCSIDPNNGAGFSGPVSGRQILNNRIDLGSWAGSSISFSGSDTGVPWFVHGIGGAIITGNNFSGNTQHIRARGTYDNSQFDWASFLTGNTFDRAVVVGVNPPADIREYSYVGGYGTISHVRRIGGTIEGEVGSALAGDMVSVGVGTYAVPSQINLNKTNLTLKGAGSASTIVQVSGTGERFFISASGTTIKDMTIEKIDKVGVQNIIYVGASNVTVRDNIIRGQFVIGEGDVSRGMVITGGLTGLQIEGNTFNALRQPAYLSGPTTGNIVNNFTYGTKGWVMEGGDMTFTGNTWGSGLQTNVYDIVILSLAPPTAYPDIVAMSNANNEAVIEDQRVSPAVLSIAFADASSSYSTDLGGRFHPYSTITPAIARVVTAGKIYVAPGLYNESVSITKQLTLDGAGSGDNPANNTVIAGPGSGGGIITVAGTSALARIVIKDVNVRNWFTGISANSFLTLDNVTSEFNIGASNRGLELPPLQDLLINNCRFNNNFIGMRAGTAANLDNVTIANSSFNNNSAQGWFIAMGGAANSSTFSNLHVTNCTFNDNLQKGIYVEKLEDAVFDGISVINSGTDPAYGFNGGIDVNLKYGAYQNIQLMNSTITGCGAMGIATNPLNAAAVAIKARDDAPSYSGNPATLDNVVITNCSISGPENALRFGEFDKVNTTPTGVVITNSAIAGNGVGKYHLVNKTVATILANTGNTFTGSATLAEKEAKIHHIADDPALGLVNYGQFVGPFAVVWVDDNWAGAVIGAVVGGHWFGYDAFATIQGGIDGVTTGGKVNVAGGVYPEAVNVNKPVELLGEDAATTTVNPGTGLQNCITVSANGCLISGLTLTGGQNGIEGTTAGSKIKNCIITANSLNGVRLIDADFNVLQGNTISGHAVGTGVLLAGSKQNTVSGNTIQNNNYNVQVDINGTRTARGNLIQGNNLLNPGVWSVNINNESKTTKVNFNVFNPADKYVRNFTTSVTQKVDATYNWFGGESTPLALHFSGAIDYTHNYATDPTVAVLPASYYLPTGTTATLDVMALLPAGTFVRGIDVTLNWTNDAQIPDQGDPIEGSFFSSFASRLYAFDRPNGSSVRVNSAILGPTGGAGNPPGGLPYVGTIFSQDFQAASEGASTLTLSGVQLRDPDNNPIAPVVIDPPGGAELLSDGTAPSVTGVFIDNTSIDNDNFIKNTDNVTVTATVTDANPLTLMDISADLSALYGGIGHTADNPSSYAANVATWTVNGATCSPTDGTIPVSISATDLAGNSGGGIDNITADNIAPTGSTAFVAKTVSPGGHQKVALSWTAGTDANYRGVEVRYNGWSYPTYPAGLPPVYPANQSAGIGVSVTPITGTATTHMIAPRNVNYYSAFAVDWAGNYSSLDPSSTDRAANYYLGDLGSGTGTYIPGSGGYDGQVNYDDLFWFSRLYFSSSPGWTSLDPNAAEGDFGPTAANKTYLAGSRFGIPLPDGRIDFEDLMIFSMNYYNVLPKIQRPENPVVADDLSLGLEGNNRAVASGDQFVVTLHLANDGRPVKGTSVSVKFDPERLQIVGVESGSLFGDGGQSFFAHQEKGNVIQVDQALLGIDRTVDYSGTLALIHFKALQSGEARLILESGIVRDGDNSELSPLLHNEVVTLPTTFALDQNFPNPFNPSTTIKYQIPSPVHVELAVFNVIGERVGTLVNEVQEPGYYIVAWNSDGTSSVSTGVYFYVLRAGEFTSIKKMMLVK